ncbi:MAG TPA: ClpXP protease specificity-enhancing factor SspB [Alphaproteobacteria bacterium]|nr:ClpXP protease specificity-enhancing factor SspB [Alphaproteobacteria bacterium]
MATRSGPLRYDKMVEDALRGVVRRSLAQVAKNGFPGSHHFYVTFRTAAPGVVLPEHLRAQYPEEMTIVLQYQFWGLEVAEDAFEVTLSFNKAHERLRVPFAALTGFVDPSVRFGLQFKGEVLAGGLAPTAPQAPAEEGGERPGQVVALDAFRKK